MRKQQIGYTFVCAKQIAGRVPQQRGKNVTTVAKCMQQIGSIALFSAASTVLLVSRETRQTIRHIVLAYKREILIFK